MLEVERITIDSQHYLKIKLRELDADLVQLITSIDGWFKAREPMTYGLPYKALGEFIKKTENHMVVWKSNADSIGSLVRGINTSDVPNEFIVEYEPKIPLREHQIITFNLLIARDSLLIADEEGLGKTIPVLCSIEAKIRHGIAKRALYITKASLIYDVKNQANMATDLNVLVIDGTSKQRVQKYSYLEMRDDIDLVVVSYETFRTDLNHFISLHKTKPFDITITDETHKCKNVQSLIGKAIHRIDSTQRYAMTASPIINEVIDMFNILSWLRLIQYNFFHFRNKFCELDRWGKVVRYKNLKEIKQILQANMLRRLKSDVLKDLPPVINKPIYVEMTPAQARLYKAVEEGKMEEIDWEDMFFEDIPSELSKYARLTQIAESAEIVGGEKGTKGSGKLKELESLLEEIIERNEKAVIFTRSKRFANIMYRHFSKYNPALITGDVDSMAKAGQEVSDRQMQVDKFQNDDSCKIIVCTDASSREGITLTKANNVIFTSKAWSPAYVRQAIGRSYRFGQKGGTTGSINVYSLIARNTVDERIEKLLSEKQFVIETVVEQPLSTKEILNVLGGVS